MYHHHYLAVQFKSDEYHDEFNIRGTPLWSMYWTMGETWHEWSWRK